MSDVENVSKKRKLDQIESNETNEQQQSNIKQQLDDNMEIDNAQNQNNESNAKNLVENKTVENNANDITMNENSSSSTIQNATTKNFIENNNTSSTSNELSSQTQTQTKQPTIDIQTKENATIPNQSSNEIQQTQTQTQTQTNENNNNAKTTTAPCLCGNNNWNLGAFTVECIHCKRMYHGECVGLRKEQTRRRKEYYCLNCEQFKPKKEKKARQAKCANPDCANLVKKRKYCSKQCGVSIALISYIQKKQAEEREMERHAPKDHPIFEKKEFEEVLTFFNESRAFPDELQQLREFSEKLGFLEKEIKSVEEERKRIQEAIEHAKNTTATNPETTEESTDRETVDCPVCGIPFANNNLPRHMDGCWNKKVKRPASKQTAPETSICGCPLSIVEQTSSNAKNYCEKSKKSCVRHFGWESLKIDRIDQEIIQNKLIMETIDAQLISLRVRIARRVLSDDPEKAKKILSKLYMSEAEEEKQLKIDQ